jgi:hypothetical protein
MKIRIFDNAKLDLLEGFSFYEDREENIGQYFLDCISSDIDSLIIYGGIHRVKNGFYWMLSKRFPFAIYYTKDKHYISIYAVIDCRQDPKKIENRIKSERTRRWS